MFAYICPAVSISGHDDLPPGRSCKRHEADMAEPTEMQSPLFPTVVTHLVPTLVPATAAVAGAPADQKKIYIKTFGCQMNVYDSERMTESLAAGYTETTEMADADLIVLNTCHIREKAVEKVYSDLGRIRQLKDERQSHGKSTIVTVAGCVAQAEGAEISRRAPVVDIVVGPQSYQRLPGLIASVQRDGRRLVETQFPDEDKFASLPARSSNKGGRAAAAFLTVQEGCDKFCTFCVVPYTRGMEFSRPVARVVAEARALVAGGVREITLLGQNVNGYHGDGADGRPCSLADLLTALSAIDGLDRLRYTTSHPRDMGDDLIAAHASLPKLMPYLHLPVQSGSDRILAGMNRKHTVDEYRQLIRRIRSARPDIALSTDIIVGFPGETESEFQATLDLVVEIGFVMAYSFKYSQRPGTPAASMDDVIPEAVKSDRLGRLQAALDGVAQKFNVGFVGQTVPVLFERVAKTSGMLLGRSPHLQLVQAPAGDDLLGRILPVAIDHAGPNTLHGTVRAA
jgi:tRNA-2-methylthio-N6-dimethylallyladenosine synthase